MAETDRLYTFYPVVIAHRGANRRAPENTLAAFRAAAEVGADAVELDAKLTADGVPVILHDPTVDRTTDGTGRVADLPLAALRELDAGSKFSPNYRGEKIPTLEEVFESLPPHLWVNVEITNYTTLWDGLEAKVVEVVHRMGMSRRVLFSSFNPLALAKAGRLAPEVPCALLTFPGLPLYLRRAWLAPLVRHEVRHPQLSQISARLLRSLKRKGKRVHAWVVNEPADVDRLLKLGVDGFITDAPDVLLRSLQGVRRARA